MSRHFVICDKENAKRAEWDKNVGSVSGDCHICGNKWVSVNERTTDLYLILPNEKEIIDILWSWYSEIIVTERVIGIINENKITGVRFEKVKGVTVKRKKDVIFKQGLWELIVENEFKADRKADIQLTEKCNVCDYEAYSPIRHGLIVDENEWDGSDFFTIIGYPLLRIVSERVKTIFEKNKIKNCIFTPAEDYRSWQCKYENSNND